MVTALVAASRAVRHAPVKRVIAGGRRRRRRVTKVKSKSSSEGRNGPLRARVRARSILPQFAGLRNVDLIAFRYCGNYGGLDSPGPREGDRLERRSSTRMGSQSLGRPGLRGRNQNRSSNRTGGGSASRVRGLGIIEKPLAELRRDRGAESSFWFILERRDERRHRTEDSARE
jgi:hypothetical protein